LVDSKLVGLYILLARRSVSEPKTSLDASLIALVIDKIALVRLVKNWDVQNLHSKKDVLMTAESLLIAARLAKSTQEDNQLESVHGTASILAERLVRRKLVLFLDVFHFTEDAKDISQSLDTLLISKLVLISRKSNPRNKTIDIPSMIQFSLEKEDVFKDSSRDTSALLSKEIHSAQKSKFMLNARTHLMLMERR